LFSDSAGNLQLGCECVLALLAYVAMTYILLITKYISFLELVLILLDMNTWGYALNLKP